MTLTPYSPSASWTQAVTVEAWATPTVTCVLVSHGQQIDVELRNLDGVPFLRKRVPNRQQARNEAAVLRLFLDGERRVDRAERVLKPFALLVEDDTDRRDGLTQAMRAAGVRVLAVGLGREGLRFALELAPDLILLEDQLPDLTGVEICRELRSQPATAAIPVVIVSGSPEPISEDDRSAAPDVVLAKPCGFETILATVRLLLRDMSLDPGVPPR